MTNFYFLYHWFCNSFNCETWFSLNSPNQFSICSKKSSFLFLKDIQSKIEGGQSFSVLAEKNSQDPGSKNNGGSLGWVERGSLVKSFETAAFTSELNKVTNLKDLQIH